ncbi:MAG TPA: ATP:cob(I)alamin adenosyltransferase, partial [Chromatiaceae bacterium]|nr:ATP:cob(I)alamin adenosyltransferase [Chromatiaceae bacterium]
MGITTKTGDKGTTGIFTGERIAKDSPIIEANGSIDELSSFIGEAKHYVDEELGKILEGIQIELYSLMAEIASKGRYMKVGEREVKRMEEIIHRLEEEVRLERFVLPGSVIA